MKQDISKNRWKVIKSFTDILDEEDIQKRSWNLKKSLGVVAAVLLLVVITINTTGCTQNSAVDDITVNAPVQEELPKENIKVGDDGVSGAIAPDDISIVADQTAKRNSSMVAMSIEDVGRSDPFLPDGAATKPKQKYNFELMPPPEAITVDTTATEVMSTKVSGIMYDRFNPSAILNISGSDYLVRTGDIVNNYKVLSIAREYVTVQNGANIYKAGVGEMFTGEGINFNTVSNLESKFGGRRNSANK